MTEPTVESPLYDLYKRDPASETGETLESFRHHTTPERWSVDPAQIERELGASSGNR